MASQWVIKTLPYHLNNVKEKIQGAHMRTEGEIAEADKYDVELKNVKLYFFENYEDS